MGYKVWKDEPVYFAPTPKLGGGWIAHKDAGDPPPPPDYAAAAESTAAGNMEMAKYTTNANRVNQTNPWGTLSWSQEAPTVTTDTARYEADMAAYNDAVAQRNAALAEGEAGGYTNYKLLKQKPPVRPDIANYQTTTEGKWTQTTALDPELQAALDSQIAVQKGRSMAAEGLLGRVQDQLGQPLDFSQLMDFKTNLPIWDKEAPEWDPSTVKKYQDAVYNDSLAMLNPQYQQQEERLRNQLALQGLSNTSEAFGSDLGNFYRNKNDAMSNLANKSLLTGLEYGTKDFGNQLNSYEAGIRGNQQALAGYNTHNATRGQQMEQLLAQYNLPLNQLNALLTGQQVKNPDFGGFYEQQQVAGPNYLDAAMQSYGDQLGIYNADSASAASGNAATGSALGTIAMAAMMFSDRRLKRNIIKIGATKGGLNVYSYNYVWSKQPQVGVMADEVEKVIPEAVHTHESGYKMVDYSKVK